MKEIALNVRLSKHHKRMLDRIAERNHISVSNLIRYWIIENDKHISRDEYAKQLQNKINKNG